MNHFLPACFRFRVEISLHALVPLFRPRVSPLWLSELKQHCVDMYTECDIMTVCRRGIVTV